MTYFIKHLNDCVVGYDIDPEDTTKDVYAHVSNTSILMCGLTQIPFTKGISCADEGICNEIMLNEVDGHGFYLVTVHGIRIFVQHNARTHTMTYYAQDGNNRFDHEVTAILAGKEVADSSIEKIPRFTHMAQVMIDANNEYINDEYSIRDNTRTYWKTRTIANNKTKCSAYRPVMFDKSKPVWTQKFNQPSFGCWLIELYIHEP
jgi:hypothetical protein